MIPDETTLHNRFARWLTEQPEALEEGVATTELLELVAFLTTLLRQNFKAVELPHLMTWIAYRVERQIREDGGLLLWTLAGERERVPVAEERSETGPDMMDLLYAHAPDTIEDLD